MRFFYEILLFGLASLLLIGCKETVKRDVVILRPTWEKRYCEVRYGQGSITLERTCIEKGRKNTRKDVMILRDGEFWAYDTECDSLTEVVMSNRRTFVTLYDKDFDMWERINKPISKKSYLTVLNFIMDDGRRLRESYMTERLYYDSSYRLWKVENPGRNIRFTQEKAKGSLIDKNLWEQR